MEVEILFRLPLTEVTNTKIMCREYFLNFFCKSEFFPGPNFVSREWRCHLNGGVPMEKFFCKVFEGENLGTGVFMKIW